MFSTKEKRRQNGVINLRRNRNFEAVVRVTHDALLPELSGDAILTSDQGKPWDDIVFEHRNKDYGAYVLRKGYSFNVLIGLGITVLVVMILIFYPRLSKFFGDNDVVAKAIPRKLVYSELSVPPSIDKPKPIPPQLQLPRLKKAVKFVPPKVVKEVIADLPPTLDEIKQHDIAAVAVEGPADVVFDEPVEEIVEEDNELFTVVDQQPEFEGGYEAMMAFIKQNMQYPANARRMQIEGTVHVSFIVSRTGSISDVKVLRGISTDCDREAVRVVQMMPAWKPGKQNGRNVNVRFILPLKFRLH